MFFDKVAQIEQIAVQRGTTIFVVPDDLTVEVKNALVLEPTEKTVITIEQVREATASLNLRQTEERFVVIRPADKLGLDAANALLKNLEEPGEKVHYILITAEPALLLPTIRSRAAIYFLKTAPEGLEIVADEEKKALAKKLLVAGERDLVGLAEEIAKKKTGVREYALGVLDTAIEMALKSYYITGKVVFLKKLPKFLAAYEGISRNGHIKLQIVANLC